MTAVEKAKEIWNKFENPPLDLTDKETFLHANILVSGILNALLDVKDVVKDDDSKNVVIENWEYYLEVQTQLTNIYKFKTIL